MARPVYSLPEQVGKRIKQARAERDHMTQSQLAAKSGIGQSAISSIERGHVQAPEANTILAISGVLRKSPRWIMYGEEQPSWAQPEDAMIGDLWHELTAEERGKLIAFGQGLLQSRPPERSRKSPPDAKRKQH